MINKQVVILNTLGAWLIACALYGYYYVVTILALPPYEPYARNWQFQLLMFSIVRLPVLILALALIIYLELMVVEFFKKRNVQQ